MRREEHRWFSPRLHRDMPLLTFGHAGPVAIVFPTSMGVFHDFDDRGMVTAVADKIDAGTLRLACVSTVDRESFYATDIPPRARLERYLVYEQYLLHELVLQQRAPAGLADDQRGVLGAGAAALAKQLVLRARDVSRRSRLRSIRAHGTTPAYG